MKFGLGIVCSLLAVYFFFIAVTSTGPVNSAWSLGYFIGSHIWWVVTAGGAYALLKKR